MNRPNRTERKRLNREALKALQAGAVISHEAAKEIKLSHRVYFKPTKSDPLGLYGRIVE